MNSQKSLVLRVGVGALALLTLSACSGGGLYKSSLASGAQNRDGAPVIQYGASDGFGSGGVHTVVNGETVFAIARQYHLSPYDLIAVNDLSAPYRVYPGMRIQLTAPQTYRARAGDNVALVAKMFGVSEKDLVLTNGLRAPYKLAAGQILNLPRVAGTHGVYPNDVTRDVAFVPPVPVVGVYREPLAPVVETTRNIEPETVQVASVGAGMMVLPRPKPKMVVPVSLTSDVPPKSWPPVVDQGRAFLRPVQGQVVSNYGRKNDGRVNEGVNIAAPKGSPVRAARDGQVVYVGDAVPGYGNLVLIKHTDGYITAYAHMDKALAKDGARVKRGQVIGTVGSTGNVDRAQLHFEIRKGRESIDPKTMI